MYCWIKINSEVLIILFAQKRKNKPTAYVPLLLLFNFACIRNSKTGVEFHKIFQCGKEFHRLKLLGCEYGSNKSQWLCKLDSRGSQSTTEVKQS